MINETQPPIPAQFRGPQGDQGPEGVGIDKIEREGKDTLVFHLTNKNIFKFTGVKGADGESPSVDEVANAVIAKLPPPEKGADGISPKIEDIISEVLKQIVIPTPKDGVSPSLEDVVAALLPQIKIPDPIKGDKGDSPKIEDIVNETLARIKIPEPIKGDKGDSPKVEDIVKEVLANIEIPKNGEDGKDAPFSTWIQIEELQGTTNAGNPSVVLKTIDLDIDNVAGVEITLIGKGANGAFFFGAKDVLVASSYKLGEDTWKFNPRRSSAGLSIEIHPVTKGFEVIAIGSPEEEMIWKGELKIATA